MTVAKNLDQLTTKKVDNKSTKDVYKKFNIQDIHYSGVDISSEMVKKSKQRGIDATQHDILKLDFEKFNLDQVNVLWCNMVIIHLSEEELSKLLFLIFQFEL